MQTENYNVAEDMKIFRLLFGRPAAFSHQAQATARSPYARATAASRALNLSPTSTPGLSAGHPRALKGNCKKTAQLFHQV